MTLQELDKAKDKDLIASVAAMKRAAASARIRAIQTHTAIVVVRKKKIVWLAAEALQKEAGQQALIKAGSIEVEGNGRAPDDP